MNIKKLSTVAILSLGLLFCCQSKIVAQVAKFGHFDRDKVLSGMPGFFEIDSLMAVYEKDTMGAEFDANLRELRKEDSFYTYRHEDLILSQSERNDKQEKMAHLFFVIQNWQQYAKKKAEQKQKQLMQPFIDTVMKAFQQVVFEQRYTCVFRKDALWYAPPADDLTISVAKKLGLTLLIKINGVVRPSELFLQ